VVEAVGVHVLLGEAVPDTLGVLEGLTEAVVLGETEGVAVGE
jgi:hypothetical protein